ncbi:class I SAM-dependent methyltransferase [Algoriphagus pacificus]|uniref:Methyltransferase domain-containing protein n=1 Tax=Algoriphagus pacificus TaxID=2811234 RepID=A0ABS3CK85_9BACT|nr:methyltransferase domain-containing protein [Algoriphagus pacificus]MBN7817523.1 methyltransferase domain-containing protein [Algoriphagus pacificus]
MNIRKELKKFRPLVRFYQKYFLPPKGAFASDQWLRVVMDQETEKLIRSLTIEQYNVLEISGSKWKDHPFKSYLNVDYPEFDICNDVKDEKFDLIIAEQVFEHLLYPYKALSNIYKMLNPGGYFLITTPFLIPIHEVPYDCTRWSPTGLKYFLNEVGFPLNQILVDGWGNKKCLISNLDYWKHYKKGMSLINETKYPLVVWSLAKKGNG